MSEEQIKKLSDENFTSEIATGVTLVDFYAEWCGPCRMLNPVLQELASEMQEVAFGKVDIDVAESVSQQFQITTVPTMILFQEGKEIGRIAGLQSKSAIRSFIETTRS